MMEMLRKVLFGGMLAVLMLAPLGAAQADTYSGGENSATLEWTLPTVGLPEVTVTLNGEPHTIGGDDAIGGTLQVIFAASDWAVTNANGGCADGQIGTSVSLEGKTPSAALRAVFTPLSGEPTSLEPQAVENRYPNVSVTVCV